MIYFVTARTVGLVKIGYSASPEGRFRCLRGDSPVPLKFERLCEGTLDDERALHERFSAHHSHGEWFALSEGIETYMAALPPAPPIGKPRPRKRTPDTPIEAEYRQLWEESGRDRRALVPSEFKKRSPATQRTALAALARAA